MSNLVTRTLSGIVYISVVISSVLLSQSVYAGIFAVIAMLAVREFCHLLTLDRWMTVVSMVLGLLLYLVFVLPQTWIVPIVVYGFALMIVLAAELFRKQPNPITNWGYLLTTQIMLVLPLALSNKILVCGGWETGRYVLLALFVCIWINDSGAYCVGSLFGKHKMFPRVSPGKSWEGLVGGFICSLLAGFVFSVFVKYYTVWEWLLIAFTVSLFGTFGDLMESLLKRTIGVKDSGKFMPGHGGVLDRFDSILLSVPAVYLLLKLLSLVG